MPPTNERELLHRLTQHDEYAFTQLFRLYYSEVYHIAALYTRSYLLAEEIANDVFVKIWLRRDHSEGILNLRTYLFVVTRHMVYKTMNRLKKHLKTIPLDNGVRVHADSDPCTWVIERERHFMLQKAVERLPARQRQVFKLVKNKGFSRKETAGILHINTETVKFHLREAMQGIRALCKSQLEL